MTINDLTIRTIENDSGDYAQMIALRMKLLLEPLGISLAFIELHKDKEDILIGVFDRSKLLGCCILTPREKNIIQLRQMAVDTPWQGRGVGRALIVFGEKIAIEKKYTKLVLHARNTVIPFYLKSGFQISSPEFFEVGIGHHQMEKNLSGL